MADFWHRNLTEERVHTPFSFLYADSTARLAATGFAPEDVNKVALQLSDATAWILTDDSPITWSLMGGAGDMLKADYDTDDDNIVNAADVAALAADIDIGGLGADTPTSGDLIVFERAGTRYKGDVDDLPGGGGVTMDQADPYGIHHRITGSHADDDEFSTNTAANYTEVDPTGTTTWVVGTNHVASCIFDNQASGDVAAFLKAITLADGEFFETCIALMNKKATNVALAGLVVTDGVLSSSNALAAQCYLSANADELMIDIRTGTLATLTTVGTSYTLASTSIMGKLKLRLKRNSSSSFTALISTESGAQFDGFGLGNVNPGFTPTHAGLIVSIGGGSAHVCMAAFDYIRHG